MRFMRRIRDEEGQALALVAVAMSLFLIAAIGLGIDGSHMFAQRQMAQTAADAAALSAIQDIYEGTYNAAGTGFTIGSFTCTTSDTRTPCAYAAKNGFGTIATDTVKVSFPASVSGVTGLATGFPAELVTVEVDRQVPTTLLRLVHGFTPASSTTVKAYATAAILSVVSPIPILVNHPTLSGAFHGNGNISVTICGGPQRSIQVNSNSASATATQGNSNSVDLSHAGPPDPGDCSGTNDPGGFFGVTGSEPSATFNISPSGNYIYQDDWIQDPLSWVTAPNPATYPVNPATTTTSGNGCPSSSCVLWSPGKYTSGIDGTGQDNLFKPGIYYLQGSTGFKCDAVCTMNMWTGTGTDITTGTGWSSGHMMVYNTGTGLFTLTANGSVNLTGAPANDANYPSILLFQDHGSVANVGTNKNTGHMLGGNGSLTLIGTLYFTNTRATMLTTSGHYQRLNLQGTPGSGTLIEGEIIADVLDLGGHGGITMNLNNAAYTVNQIALVR